MYFYKLLESIPTNEYYKPTPDKFFKEIKIKSIAIWRKYDDTFGYSSEKINQIKDLENISDNTWFMINMFDFNNQLILFESLSKYSKNYIIKSIKKYDNKKL